ncbi:MAG: zinc-binding dehydrogenase, partial [Maribacter sp.]
NERLIYSKNEIGVVHTLNVKDGPQEKIAEITGGDMATAVFDATGSRKALESGIAYMAHGGRCILVGLSKGELTYNHPQIHAKETTLMCSRNATLEDFKFVMNHIKEFPTNSFITHEVHFSEMIENFDSWLLPETGVVKAMVNFDENKGS